MRGVGNLRESHRRIRGPSAAERRRPARADDKEGKQGKGKGANEAERDVAAARGYRHPALAFWLWRGKKAVLVKFVKNAK